MICPPIRCAFGMLAILLMSATATASGVPDIRVPDTWAAPNLFGTVAMQVNQTPYDSKWERAGIGRRGPVPPSDRRRAGPPSFLDLEKVQSDINRRVSFRADPSHLDAGDAWSPASRTLARRSGDCEDYAIAKGQSLLALGFPPKDIYLVIGKHLRLKTAHAILAVRVDSAFWILDNLSRQVVRADRFRNFSPVITFSADRKWVHGYERRSFRRLANTQSRAPGGSADRLFTAKISRSPFPPARLLR